MPSHAVAYCATGSLARPRDSIFGYAFSIPLRWSVPPRLACGREISLEAILANFSALTKSLT